jgi:uncharacterized protein YcaQ
MHVARLLAPVSAVSLRGALALMARRNPGLGVLPAVVAAALEDGELVSASCGGETYLWPAALTPAADRPAPRAVRLLAPFDPIVWDRRRFAHLWGWEYRFEAYTPPPQRRFGYYALPLLWADQVIGWANVTLVGGAMQVETGYAGPAPKTLAFRRALDAELTRMEMFLTAPARNTRTLLKTA